MEILKVQVPKNRDEIIYKLQVISFLYIMMNDLENGHIATLILKKDNGTPLKIAADR